MTNQTNIPGPRSLPILGALPQLIKLGGLGQPFFQWLHDQHGGVVKFSILGNQNISVADPDLALEVYKKAPTRPKETEMFLGYLGKENLLFERSHERVKYLRDKYTVAANSPASLEAVTKASFETVNGKFDEWKNKTIDFQEEIDSLVYDVVGKGLFGRSWSDSALGQKIYKHHLYLTQNSMKWAFVPFKPTFLPSYREYANHIEQLRTAVNQLLDIQKAQLAESDADISKVDSLNMILASEANDPDFSRELGISTVIGFLNGAYDTSHGAMLWISYHLAANPDVQAELFEALKAAALFDEEPTPKALLACEPLQHFILESMRRITTVPVNQRVNLDQDIEIGPYTIKKGTNINLPMGVTSNKMSHFGCPHANTEQIYPARFARDNECPHDPHKYHTPFGASGRKCVGVAFATVELSALIVALLQRFELSTSIEYPELDVRAGVHKSKFPLLLEMKERTA